MAATLIATRGTDKLFVTSRTRSADGLDVFAGYIEDEDGARIAVANVEALLARGYWDEIVD